MTPVTELIRWANTLPGTNSVGIDDGGLTLVALNERGQRTGAYLELGGEPDDSIPDMPWCKWCKSWHVVPQTKQHHADLKCKAPWRLPLKKPRAKRIIGVCEDAKTLGVCREHLYRVLAGKRVSKSLTARYNTLKKGRTK